MTSLFAIGFVNCYHKDELSKDTAVWQQIAPYFGEDTTTEVRKVVRFLELLMIIAIDTRIVYSDAVPLNKEDLEIN